MNLLDRLLVRSYLKSYFICLVSLLTLYIVVDLFNNLDEFILKHDALLPVLKHIAAYYSYSSTRIFDRLSEAIVLLAAAFTVAWIQRNNELLPLLSAGVPTRRVVLPVLATACAMLAVSVLNQELVMSQIGEHLFSERGAANDERLLGVRGAYEPNGILVEGKVAMRKGMVIKDFHLTIPPTLAGSLFELFAQRAYYVPPKEGQKHSGGWLLTGTQVPGLPSEQQESWSLPELELIDPGKYFLYTTQVDFDMVTRANNWYVYASTARLLQELRRPESSQLTALAVLFHMRLTRPILGIILVLLGLSVILRDQNRNVFVSAGLCLLVCAIFFAAQFACKSLGDNGAISPALAAWLPVLGFGPLSLVLFDAIHT